MLNIGQGFSFCERFLRPSYSGLFLVPLSRIPPSQCLRCIRDRELRTEHRVPTFDNMDADSAVCELWCGYDLLSTCVRWEGPFVHALEAWMNHGILPPHIFLFVNHAISPPVNFLIFVQPQSPRTMTMAVDQICGRTREAPASVSSRSREAV